MVKVIEMPPANERCVLPEVFGEAAIMLRYAMRPLPPLPGADDAEAEAHAAKRKAGAGQRHDQQGHTHTQPHPQQLPLPPPEAAWAAAGRGGNPCVCQLLDVGLVPDAYWIVMPQYQCSLAQWRASPQQQPPSRPRAAAVYLAVLAQVG